MFAGNKRQEDGMAERVGDVIDRIGMGRFQRKLLWACGASWATDAMEVLLIGFAIPSLIADWNLSTQQAGLLASALFVGMLTGAWFWGAFSDYRGRRFSFLATIGIDSIFGLLSAFAPNFAVLLILRFCTGFGVGGSLPVDYAIFSEFLPTRQRGRYLVYLESFWALGTIVAATLAWLIIPQFPEMGWRFLLAASAVPGLIVFWLRRTIPESPRYLMLQGREAEAQAVLARIARENGAQIEVGPLAAEPQQVKAPLATIFDRTYLRTTLMLTAVWFLLSLGYYGLFTWLPGIFRAQGFTFLATFQNTVLLALAQVPGYFSAAWLVERWGRVRTLGVYLAGSALATFFFAVLRDQTSIVLASVVMSFFALGAWGVVYAYTPELYPTSARGTGMGWAGGVARIAGVIAPLIGAYLLNVDLAIALGFYALAFAAAALVVFVAGQETMNRPLEEVEHQRGDVRNAV
jgi:putative MFS transporter